MLMLKIGLENKLPAQTNRDLDLPLLLRQKYLGIMQALGVRTAQGSRSLRILEWGFGVASDLGCSRTSTFDQ